MCGCVCLGISLDLSVVPTTSDSVHLQSANSSAPSASSLLASTSEPSQDVPGPSTICPDMAPDSTMEVHSGAPGPSNTTTPTEGEVTLDGTLFRFAGVGNIILVNYRKIEMFTWL